MCVQCSLHHSSLLKSDGCAVHTAGLDFLWLADLHFKLHSFRPDMLYQSQIVWLQNYTRRQGKRPANKQANKGFSWLGFKIDMWGRKQALWFILKRGKVNEGHFVKDLRWHFGLSPQRCALFVYVVILFMFLPQILPVVLCADCLELSWIHFPWRLWGVHT